MSILMKVHNKNIILIRFSKLKKNSQKVGNKIYKYKFTFINFMIRLITIVLILYKYLYN